MPFYTKELSNLIVLLSFSDLFVLSVIILYVFILFIMLHPVASIDQALQVRLNLSTSIITGCLRSDCIWDSNRKGHISITWNLHSQMRLLGVCYGLKSIPLLLCYWGKRLNCLHFFFPGPLFSVFSKIQLY